MAYILSKQRIGEKFGRLTIISTYRKAGRTLATCVCHCGIVKDILMTSLVSGRTKSCGCVYYSSNKRHGKSKHPLYRIFSQMNEKCYNPKHHAYKDYGERGIFISSEWTAFMQFYTWSISNGYATGLTLDRRYNDGPYAPENIHTKVYKAASGPKALQMDSWHTCDTTHCRAGWAVFLAGEEGRKLEEKTSTLFAAMQIYHKSSPIQVSPVRFFEDNKTALDDMRRCASEETSIPQTAE